MARANIHCGEKARDARARIARRVARDLVTALGMSVLVVALAGCERDGGGDDPPGTSTIQGNVVSFAGSGAAAGIGVALASEGVETATGDGGLFVMSGIHGGYHDLIFTHGGMQAACGVKDQPDATVVLRDIRIDGDGKVHVASAFVAASAAGPGSSYGPGSAGSPVTDGSTPAPTPTPSPAPTPTPTPSPGPGIPPPPLPGG